MVRLRPEPNVELFMTQTKLSVLSKIRLNEFGPSIMFYLPASDGNTYLDLCGLRGLKDVALILRVNGTF